jgi:hypothetical protein
MAFVENRAADRGAERARFLIANIVGVIEGSKWLRRGSDGYEEKRGKWLRQAGQCSPGYSSTTFRRPVLHISSGLLADSSANFLQSIHLRHRP